MVNTFCWIFFFKPSPGLLALCVGGRSILRDESRFGPDPDTFSPERFLKPGVAEPIAAFGFGRRCVFFIDFSFFFVSWRYLFPTTKTLLALIINIFLSEILKQSDGRVCPGRHFAENTLFIAVSSMLHVFKMGRAVGDDGKEVPIPGTFTSGMLWCI